MPRQRLIVLTLLFLGAFVIVAQLAWTTAGDTTGPWFSPAVSRDIYSTTMIAATLLVATLAALASVQTSAVAREGRSLDLRLAILRGSGVTATGGGIDIDQDIEETLDEILGSASEAPTPVVTVEKKEAHDTLITVSTIEGKVLRQDVVLKEVVRARAALQTASARIWTAVAGPLAAGIAFLGIAGAMLPGSEGFAETHFVLNNAVVLFLAYGWTLLAGWVAVGLGFAHTSEGRPAVPETKHV
jgi:low affinity Fe/Cu permease